MKSISKNTTQQKPANRSYGSFLTACKGKIRYESMEAARYAAKTLRKQKGPRTKPYGCAHCGGFHNGHDRRKQNWKNKKVNKSIDK